MSAGTQRRMHLWLTGVLALTACDCNPDTPATPDWLNEPRPADELAQAPDDRPRLPEGVVTANNRFAVALYAQLRESPGNLAFSPASIATALTMIFAGARGDTAKDMADGLRFNGLPIADIHASYREQLSAWNEDHQGAYELQVANRLFAEQTLTINAAFAALARDNYGAAPQALDFRGAPEAARRRINEWIEDNTNRLIVDLLPPSSVSSATQVVLANAVYFKGRWRDPFDAADTESLPFFSPQGERSIPTMVGDGDYLQHEGDEVTVVRLRYVGDFEMLVLMSDAHDGLGALEERLTPERLASWLGGGRFMNARLFLPRFRYAPDAAVMLGEPLRELGMVRVFGSDADFSGMISEPIAISQVAHRAFVEVSEEGTVAAAASAAYGIMGPGPRELRIDHPFMFLIRDTRTGGWLFLGRIVDPS